MAPASSLVKAPESLVGYVDEGAFFSLLTEAYETIPDLMFPASVIAYSQMRRDPQLTAVLQAYTLPIRRATWTVDPAGCRDEVVQLVADDMGLPILGRDKPGAARMRGLSWAEHLRQALLHLVYGFYGFELLADTSSGQARLVNAYERVPQTITWIHSTPVGDFGGISQLGLAGHEATAEIGPERMVWYAHDREGSAWHGNSVLRSSYAPWLLKREMQRVLATSNRRFGMGVPTVEWSPGFIPSPEQMQAAQQAASAARVGDTAGLAMPPNAHLVLTGLSGGAPDTLAFLKWLDQQMSRTTLAGFLDLADTKFGSRALGSSFIDLFTLSITAVAEYVADVATRQIAARLVGWNWGDNEPVPAVKVTDIGTKHEVTAEAIQALMAAGAITPDPALEEYMRQAFQLPQRSIPWVPPVRKGGSTQATGNVLADGNGDGTTDATSVVASAKRPTRTPRKRKQPDGQMALPIAAAASDEPQPRDLTADELASGVDFQRIQADHDTAVAALVAAMPALLAPIAAGLIAEVSADLATGAISTLGSLAPDSSAVAALGDAIAEQATNLAADSAWLAGVEVSRIGLPVSDVTLDEAALTEHAQATAQLIATGMAQAASRTALLHNGPGVDPATVTAAVQADLDALAVDERNWIVGSLSSCMAAAQHSGRMAAFNTLIETHGADAATLVASEVNDKNVCSVCHAADGKRFDTFEEALAMYPTGRNIGCLGRDRCRGVLFAVKAN